MIHNHESPLRTLVRRTCLLLAILAPLVLQPAIAGNRVLADGPIRVEAEEDDRAFLGISFRPARGEEGGIQVIHVVSGSAAERAGIQEGDVIVEIDGQGSGRKGLAAAIGSRRPGDVAELTLLRDGRREPVDVELGSRGARLRIEAEGEWLVWTPSSRIRIHDGTAIHGTHGELDDVYVCGGEDDCAFGSGDWYKVDCIGKGCAVYDVPWFGRPLLGVSVVSTTAELRRHLGGDRDSGVLIGKVHASSPAAEAGIEVGDLIVAVDGDPVRDAGDIGRILQEGRAGGSIEVEVVRDGGPLRLRVDLPDVDTEVRRR